MKYKCVIFDCDGVLVDSELISCKVLVEMAGGLGLNVSLETAIAEFSGRSFKSIVEYITFLIKEDVPTNFEVEFRQKTFDAFKEDLEPIAGISELLENLTIPFCVASSGPRAKIIHNLTKVNLIDKFPQNSIFSCYEIGRWKPDPEIYLCAANKMGYKPEECAVIEDSIYGVTAAIFGGFDTFVYAKNHDNKTFENMGALVFNDMNNLETLLSQ